VQYVLNFKTGNLMISHSHTFLEKGILAPPTSWFHWMITLIGHHSDPSLSNIKCCRSISSIFILFLIGMVITGFSVRSLIPTLTHSTDDSTPLPAIADLTKPEPTLQNQRP